MKIARGSEVGDMTDLGVGLVVRFPIFSQSGVLSYFSYEFGHPRPIDCANGIVPVLHVQRRVIRDLFLWLQRSGRFDVIRSVGHRELR
jgi:hypothetical protein